MQISMEAIVVRLLQGNFLFGLGLRQQCRHKGEMLEEQVCADGLNFRGILLY